MRAGPKGVEGTAGSQLWKHRLYAEGEAPWPRAAF
jgi:hypothetical protein